VESPVFSPQDEAVIQNHVNEIAALPEDRFTEFKELVVRHRRDAIGLETFLHPDRPGHAIDLGYQLVSKSHLAIEIVRRATEIREIRGAGSQNG